MLKVYTLEQNEEWDKIVRSFIDYDVYYLSGYVKAFQLHGDGEPMLFFYQGNNSRGINVVMKRDIAKDKHFIGKIPVETYFDFATPYGYGGWLVEGQGELEQLHKEYEEWCKQHSIVCEFVRFHPVLKNHIFSSESYEVIPLGETVAMDISDVDTIWNNIISKNRNMIRKAQKNGIKIYNGRYPEIYNVFREIYNGTMDKDNADDYYYFENPFYISIMNDLPQNSQVFYAELESKVIAAAIMLMANGRLNYHLSGSIKEYATLAPTNLLLYEAALWGCENGYKTFHLGGGVGSGEDSLFKFKRAFYKGELNRFYIGKKMFNKDRYNELVNMRDDLKETIFFPRYRV